MSQYKECVSFCNNVRDLRKKYKLTKKEMCVIMGIGLHSLNLIEKGIMPKRLDLKAAFRLWIYFGIEPQNLFKDLHIL